MSRQSPTQFAIAVAAEAFRVKREQIEHDLKHGRFPNARKEGGWVIPRKDLEAAGYRIDSRWQKRHVAYLRNARRISHQD